MSILISAFERYFPLVIKKYGWSDNLAKESCLRSIDLHIVMQQNMPDEELDLCSGEEATRTAKKVMSNASMKGIRV